ncbi:protein abrupt isoform X2 [Copidosoma floridanum]|uniref:protein abrupt isoform X2 n=1 Tax=Copidosoma floridanum TaxID=29053 RepID=UPI0006C98545|nr:protein abrupt isoform X2 [Copidosoma floridanum]
MAASSSSSSGEQQYSLRWNDYHSSIVNSFRHLRDEEDFVDVTLACDNSSFTAHKVVLSACSPYFRKLLKANPCQHPIVILRDVSSSDMESLLRFMYHGEVHVGQEQLTAFIKTAQMLQVRGLADVPAITSKVQTATSSTPHNASAPTTPRNLWQDSMRSDLNDSGLSPPPEKRPRSYSPSLVNHIEAKSDIHESLLSQALEGGPTIHTTASANNNQAQSVGEDSNSISDNEEETLNNDSMLNSVKTEPSELLNDSLEHHRNSFPAALLSLQGLMPGPSGIHAAANADPNYGRWQPSGGEGSGSGSCSGWLTGNSSASRTDAAGLQLQQHQLPPHHPATSQQPQQQAFGGLNPDQISSLMQQQKLHKQHATSEQQLSLMLQSCGKKKMEELAVNALLHPFQHQLDNVGNSRQSKPKCPECSKIYSNNSNLKQHIVNCHTFHPQYISCHVCSKQFKTKQYLQIHLLSMHGIRKRKSYPVYQMQTHAQAQQQQQHHIQYQHQPNPQQHQSSSSLWNAVAAVAAAAELKQQQPQQ